MNIEEARSKTDSELRFDLANFKKELFGLRFRASAEASNNPSRARTVRRSIARVTTVLHERATGINGQKPR
jgi:large subunit ribosomal protein L29